MTSGEFRVLAHAAWREFQSAMGRYGIVDGIHDTPEPPHWFVTCELGEGVCPCERCLADPERITVSFLRWREENADALAYLFSDPPPPGCA